ncbi:8893_t:CDS:10 [Acaulospora morrowiae]|uniref:8893_t:CDS:1 n=1 Tax=Acaulospora morrowiae TaxID=94023 RepID=A0A9N8YLC6_9GLOM|nr:8893_t:CDS:10 [Acaulospora morrowiae]
MNIDIRSLPPEFQSRLLGLERELRDGDITEKGYEKKKNAILEECRRQYASPSFSSGGDPSFKSGSGYYNNNSPRASYQSVQSTGYIDQGSQFVQSGRMPQRPPLPPTNLAYTTTPQRPPSHNPNMVLQRSQQTVSLDIDRTRNPNSAHVRTQSVDQIHRSHQLRQQPHALTSSSYGPQVFNKQPIQPHYRPLSGGPTGQQRPHFYPTGQQQFVSYARPIQPSFQSRPTMPQIRPPVGELSGMPNSSGVISKAYPAVLNENGRQSLDVNDTMRDYERFQDDNVSIRSNIMGIVNPDMPRFGGFTQPVDNPGRNAGNRMSLYNSRVFSDTQENLSTSLDVNISKLAGKQFMPFEPRDIPFENLDPLDPTRSLDSFTDIASILRYRGKTTPKKNAFIVVDQKGRETGVWTWEKLQLRAEKLGQIILRESGLVKGDRVALIYRKNEILEFLVALYGCFIAGVVAVPINAVEEFKELLFILDSTEAKLALTTEHNHKVFVRELSLQNKELPTNIGWWKTNEFGSVNVKKGDELDSINCTELAYIEYTKSPNGELKGVAISHKTIIAQCTSMRASAVDTRIREQMIKYSKMKSENFTLGKKGDEGASVNYADIVLTYLEPRQQVGLIIGALWGVYCGNTTIFLGSLGPDVPGLWVNFIFKYQVTIALADYPGLNPIVASFKSDPGATLHFYKKTTPNLQSLRFLFIDSLTVDTESNQNIIDNLLTPLNCMYPKDVLTPLSSLPEHGGMILSFGDLLGVMGLDERIEGERGVKEFLLDRETLKENKVIAIAEEENKSIKSVMKVGAFGFVMPEATIAVVDPETTALCLPNTVGEIWVDSPSLSGGFWSLPKLTEFIFHAKPIFVPADTMKPEYLEQEFLRTGLLGALISGQLVIFGLYEHRIRQSIESPQQKAPVKLVSLYSGSRKYCSEEDQCVMIEVYTNDQNLPVLIAETNLPLDRLPNLSDNIHGLLYENHGLRLYCLSLCQQGSLPRSWKNGKKLINAILCKKAFEVGKLNVMHVQTWVEETITNIPVGDDDVAGIWGPVAMAARHELNNGITRRPQFSRVGSPNEVKDERTGQNMLTFRSIVDVLLWRTENMPDGDAYKVLDIRGKELGLSWKKLNNRIATFANYMLKKGLKSGDHVLLMFPQGLDFVCSVYACMVLGIIAIPMDRIEQSRAGEDIPSMMGLIEDFKINYIILNTETENTFKGKTIQNYIKSQNGGIARLPQFLNVSKAPKFTKLLSEANYVMREEWINQNWTAIVMCYFNAEQRRSCVKLGHDTLLALCKVQKATCKLTSNKAVLGCVRGCSGIGFVHTCLLGAYLGSPTILITPYDYSVNPLIWFETLSRYKIKDSYTTFPMLQHAISCFEGDAFKSFSLQHLKNLMLPIESRPNVNLFKQVIKTFLPNRLDDMSLNYVYGNQANPMLTTRSYMCIEPIELYLDLKSLRRGIIKIVDPEEEPFGVLIQDCGMVPVSTQIVIVHPETRRPCLTNEFGEIWVSSDANAKSSYGSNDPLERERFSARVDGGISLGIDPRTTHLRTGDLGFLHTVHRPAGENNTMVEFQCLFVLGPIAETFEVNGLMHFPVDIEFTVERCHNMSPPSLIAPDGCVVFQANNETVCVVEVRSTEGILNLVPCILNTILDEHQFIIDVIVFIVQGSLPKSRLGEKQRAKVMSNWISGHLPTLYVHHVKQTKYVQEHHVTANFLSSYINDITLHDDTLPPNNV